MKISSNYNSLIYILYIFEKIAAISHYKKYGELRELKQDDIENIIKSFIENISQHVDIDENKYLMFEGKLLSNFYLIVQKCFSIYNHDKKVDHKIFRKLNRYIHDLMHVKIKLQGLSNVILCEINQEYLNSIFDEFTESYIRKRIGVNPEIFFYANMNLFIFEDKFIKMNEEDCKNTLMERFKVIFSMNNINDSNLTDLRDTYFNILKDTFGFINLCVSYVDSSVTAQEMITRDLMQNLTSFIIMK